jgi:cation:H+ antiporter
MEFIITVIVTLALLLAIVWGCAIFTNGVEWLGQRYKLSEGAVGSVLAAVGTALPETLIPVVALFGGFILEWATGEVPEHLAENAEHIGVGAILGAAFSI